MEAWIIVLIIVAVLVLFMIFLMVATRYKKCPPDKIMVIYGKVGADREGNARSASASTAAPPSSGRSCRRSPTST